MSRKISSTASKAGKGGSSSKGAKAKGDVKHKQEEEQEQEVVVQGNACCMLHRMLLCWVMLGYVGVCWSDVALHCGGVVCQTRWTMERRVRMTARMASSMMMMREAMMEIGRASCRERVCQ